MSSVLRSEARTHVGRGRRHRPRGVRVELEVDAKVELIRSMHIEELLDEEVTALAGEATQSPVSRRAPSWQQPRDGRVGRPARAERAPDSPCHGARDSTAVVRGAAWRSRRQ